jgi:VanZ family protein
MIMKISSIISVWLPLVLWMMVIFQFSITTQPQIPGQPGEDVSYLHIPVYFVLSALFLRVFLTGKRVDKRGLLLSIALATAYGAAMETIQFFSQVRLFDFLDILLNLAGSCIVLVFAARPIGKIMLMKS